LLRVGEQLRVVIYAAVNNDNLEIGINRNIVMALVFNCGYAVMVVALPHSLINRN